MTEQNETPITGEAPATGEATEIRRIGSTELAEGFKVASPVRDNQASIEYYLTMTWYRGLFFGYFNERLLPLLTSEGEVCGASIDVQRFSINIYCYSRRQISAALQLFGGDWDRTDAGNGQINYQQELHLPWVESKANIYIQGPPPPTCSIVEVEEVVPEHKRLVRKVVCK